MLDDLPEIIRLDGVTNLRDLGGWPTPRGIRMRKGLIYRGASLSALTAADLARLGALGVRVVIDFRGEAERARAPSRAGGVAGLDVRDAPIEPSVGSSLRDLMAMRDAAGEDAMFLMRRAYVAYALDCAHQYRKLFDAILEGEGGVLFHCTAGKDRTGFGAALVLSSLGVIREHVMSDYMATNELWRPPADALENFEPAVGAVLLKVHAELLDAAFAAIDEKYGSIDRYFDDALGLDAPRMARLRALCLENGPA